MKRLTPMLCLLCLAALPAAAEGFRPSDLEAWLGGATSVRADKAGQWKVNAGVGVGAVPEYRGAKEFQFTVLPLLDVEWRGKAFFSTQRGIGYNLLSARNYSIGPRLTIDPGRDSSINSRLAGVPDVDVGFEPGLFSEFFLGPWRLRADVRQGVLSGHEGFLGSADVSYGGRFTEATSLIVGGDVHWTDGSYAEAYFNVPAAAARLPAFDADSGFRDIGGHASLIYEFSRRYYLSLEGRLSLLLGDAGDSPVSDDNLQLFLGVVIGYRF